MRRMTSRTRVGDGVVITSEGKTCERGGRQLLHSRGGNTKGHDQHRSKATFR
jgi:hypothetical protein